MALTPQDAFRERMREWRDRRGWNQSELAAEVSKLAVDFSMDQPAISAIESGTRRVTLDEAFVIAAALNVPPPLLWLSLGSERRVQISKKSNIHPLLALKWFTGKAPLATTSRKAIRSAEWHEAAEPLRLYERLETLQEHAVQLEADIRAAEYIGDERAETRARAAFAKALKALVAHRRFMRDAGHNVLLALPEGFEEVVKQLGLDREEQ